MRKGCFLLKWTRCTVIALFLIVFGVFASCYHDQQQGRQPPDAGNSSCSTGLRFFSHENVQDKRTGLNLTPEKPVCPKNDFQLSFDLKFERGHKIYFGYIFRIIKNDLLNIDLLYDDDIHNEKHFSLIVGNQKPISFNIPANKIFDSWVKVNLKFNLQKQMLDLAVNNNYYQVKIPLKKKDCYRFFFGANGYKTFTTSDVPPMILKNIVLDEGKDMSYQWKLDQDSGNHVLETHQLPAALVTNPYWIKSDYIHWKKVKEFTTSTAASIAFDLEEGNFFVAGKDSLIVYNLKTGHQKSVIYASGPRHLMQGNQSLFVKENQTLYNYFTDEKLFTSFDFGKHRWSKNYSSDTTVTAFWHTNKFFSPSDSSIYTLGGYGYRTYKNAVNKYHIGTRQWNRAAIENESYVPRYLSAVGAGKNGAYILGGYGSVTGKQILSPKNLYDLLYFDVARKKIRKIYELPQFAESSVFANSLLINESKDSYYALVFPQNRYNTYLKLIEGSLKKPVYGYLADSIPYKFNDIHSFADLYYSSKTNQLVAATSFDDGTETVIKLYLIQNPPEKSLARVLKLKEPLANPLIWTLLSILFTIFVLVIFIKKRKHKKMLPEYQKREADQTTPERKDQIQLFGDFQIFDDQGIEISKRFPPLVKELFMVILIYSIKEKGISSRKLYELLWSDKSIESARNNKAVNVAKLKVILEKVSSCQVVTEIGSLKIVFDEKQLHIDYYSYVQILRSKNHSWNDKFKFMIPIIDKGSFLSGMNYSWLDAIKSEITSEITDAYINEIRANGFAEDPQFQIKLANCIFYFDPVNEEAMMVKCRSLSVMGMHSLSKKAFDSFVVQYRQIYNTDFLPSFYDIIGKN